VDVITRLAQTDI